MANIYNKPGFDFSNVIRNSFLETKGIPLPKATSTGTTIVGCLYKDGVVLGADTRATSGPIVADKNCEKIHYIAENIRCCGAGTAADTEFTTALISSNIALHALQTAMAIFETEWQAGLERDAAVDLVSKAIQAGIFNDLGSGSNVDVCIITKDRTEMLRNYLTPNEKVEKEKRYKFSRGTTDWKRDREIVRSLVVHEETRPIAAGDDTMDTS
ncbi:proteasome core particle subunit beta 2 [Serendipita sp. 407]|nr:proteasome core particle subunit beta 2 [Serendipita sp. 407]